MNDVFSLADLVIYFNPTIDEKITMNSIGEMTTCRYVHEVI